MKKIQVMKITLLNIPLKNKQYRFTLRFPYTVLNVPDGRDLYINALAANNLSTLFREIKIPVEEV